MTETTMTPEERLAPKCSACLTRGKKRVATFLVAITHLGTHKLRWERACDECISTWKEYNILRKKSPVYPILRGQDAEYAAIELLRGKYKYFVATDYADEAIKKANQIERSAYYREIRDIALEAKRSVNSKELDRNSLERWIDETVDGHSDVIYTHEAMRVCMTSDNAGVGVEDGVVDASSFNDGIPWSKLAYCAMQRDVVECLDSLGVDVNDPEPNERNGISKEHVGVFCEQCFTGSTDPAYVRLTPGSTFKCLMCDDAYVVPDEAEKEDE